MCSTLILPCMASQTTVLNADILREIFEFVGFSDTAAGAFLVLEEFPLAKLYDAHKHAPPSFAHHVRTIAILNTDRVGNGPFIRICSEAYLLDTWWLPSGSSQSAPLPELHLISCYCIESSLAISEDWRSSILRIYLDSGCGGQLCGSWSPYFPVLTHLGMRENAANRARILQHANAFLTSASRLQVLCPRPYTPAPNLCATGIWKALRTLRDERILLSQTADMSMASDRSVQNNEPGMDHIVARTREIFCKYVSGVEDPWAVGERVHVSGVVSSTLPSKRGPPSHELPILYNHVHSLLQTLKHPQHVTVTVHDTVTAGLRTSAQRRTLLGKSGEVIKARNFGQGDPEPAYEVMIMIIRTKVGVALDVQCGKARCARSCLQRALQGPREIHFERLAALLHAARAPISKSPRTSEHSPSCRDCAFARAKRTEEFDREKSEKYEEGLGMDCEVPNGAAQHFDGFERIAERRNDRTSSYPSQTTLLPAGDLTCGRDRRVRGLSLGVPEYESVEFRWHHFTTYQTLHQIASEDLENMWKFATTAPQGIPDSELRFSHATRLETGLRATQLRSGSHVKALAISSQTRGHAVIANPVRRMQHLGKTVPSQNHLIQIRPPRSLPTQILGQRQNLREHWQQLAVQIVQKQELSVGCRSSGEMRTSRLHNEGHVSSVANSIPTGFEKDEELVGSRDSSSEWGQIVFPRARSEQIRTTTLKAAGQKWNRFYPREGRWPKPACTSCGAPRAFGFGELGDSGVADAAQFQDFVALTPDLLCIDTNVLSAGTQVSSVLVGERRPPFHTDLLNFAFPALDVSFLVSRFRFGGDMAIAVRRETPVGVHYLHFVLGLVLTGGMVVIVDSRPRSARHLQNWEYQPKRLRRHSDALHTPETIAPSLGSCSRRARAPDVLRTLQAHSSALIARLNAIRDGLVELDENGVLGVRDGPVSPVVHQALFEVVHEVTKGGWPVMGWLPGPSETCNSGQHWLYPPRHAVYLFCHKIDTPLILLRVSKTAGMNATSKALFKYVCWAARRKALRAHNIFQKHVSGVEDPWAVGERLYAKEYTLANWWTTRAHKPKAPRTLQHPLLSRRDVHLRKFFYAQYPKISQLPDATPSEADQMSNKSCASALATGVGFGNGRGPQDRSFGLSIQISIVRHGFDCPLQPDHAYRYSARASAQAAWEERLQAAEEETEMLCGEVALPITDSGMSMDVDDTSPAMHARALNLLPRQQVSVVARRPPLGVTNFPKRKFCNTEDHAEPEAPISVHAWPSRYALHDTLIMLGVHPFKVPAADFLMCDIHHAAGTRVLPNESPRQTSTTLGQRVICDMTRELVRPSRIKWNGRSGYRVAISALQNQGGRRTVLSSTEAGRPVAPHPSAPARAVKSYGQAGTSPGLWEPSVPIGQPAVASVPIGRPAAVSPAVQIGMFGASPLAQRAFRSPPRYSLRSLLYWPVPTCIRNQTYFRTALSIHRTIPGTSDRSLLYSQTAEVLYTDRSLLYPQTAETDLTRVLAGLTSVRCNTWIVFKII
ncbi:hypothetical protein EXIGLDRAFT_788260 [Exidia glandulosa HHB12029]|uniref:Uncharacterized protein n=1 Tax=Exidia glandulosa HHB12029 TaxID=1314781 RepID=A0A165P6H4_EXIGL|nr:hypothetical protein EXIGLDRAFT_788260 [Exidia glandulosa HHB12029]